LSLPSQEKATLAAQIAVEKKACHPVLLDLRDLTLITDFFLICHGNSDVHVRAIADAMLEGFTEQGIRHIGMEGREDARWVLLDFGDLVVHVFLEEDRAYFDLERLWGDAPKTELASS